MTKTIQTITSVGIDVSKDKLDVALLCANQDHIQQTFDNSTSGIQLLITCLRKQGTAVTVPCVIESTGNYHLQSTLMIAQAGFTVKVINPLITKKYQQSSVRNAKSDPIDAHRLAQIGLLEPELPKFTANVSIVGIKKIVSYLAHLEKVKLQLAMSLKQMQSTQKLFGYSVNLSASEQAIAAIAEQIEVLEYAIRCQAPKEAKQLARNYPGVTERKISVLLALLADKAFAGRDQLIAYVGLDVALRKSGKWQGRQKLTKRGNPFARKVLYQIAWGLKQHHPDYQRYYDRLYREQGKHYTTTLIAIARKFLRFLYAYYWQGTACPQPSA